MGIGANVFVINVDFVDATARREERENQMRNYYDILHVCGRGINANELRIHTTNGVAYF